MMDWFPYKSFSRSSRCCFYFFRCLAKLWYISRTGLASDFFIDRGNVTLLIIRTGFRWVFSNHLPSSISAGLSRSINFCQDFWDEIFFQLPYPSVFLDFFDFSSLEIFQIFDATIFPDLFKIIAFFSGQEQSSLVVKT